uniref:COMM domain-containing protein 10 n=1 Tax=Panagrolaimus sp. JU765 TaxID=591449 RepID=A0AC34QQV9_9BILA
MSLIVLPPGSKHGIQSINKIPSSSLKKMSEKILQLLPSTKSSDFSFFEDSNLTKAEFSLAINVLIGLWKQVAYHSLKPTKLIRELEAVELSQEVIEVFVNVWQQNSDQVLGRLRTLSRSGIPEFEKLNWGISIERATTFEPKKRQVRAMLEIDTSQGKKYAKLSFDELQKLHFQLQEIQKRIDSITK